MKIPDFESLMTHIKKHKRETGKFYFKKCYLTAHINLVQKGNLYPCDECDKKYTRKEILSKHIKASQAIY